MNHEFNFYPLFGEFGYILREDARLIMRNGVLYLILDGKEEKIGAVSAYAVAKENGYEGTEEEWIETIMSCAASARVANAAAGNCTSLINARIREANEAAELMGDPIPAESISQMYTGEAG